MAATVVGDDNLDEDLDVDVPPLIFTLCVECGDSEDTKGCFLGVKGPLPL